MPLIGLVWHLNLTVGRSWSESRLGLLLEHVWVFFSVLHQSQNRYHWSMDGSKFHLGVNVCCPAMDRQTIPGVSFLHPTLAGMDSIIPMSTKGGKTFYF